ncbi:MAG TPA: FmdB family zinc ribbon protein [Actinomycetota bacterium]|nr:FmdB family zinc ribbon protein [Actinomycetota bacterium]
MPIYEYACTSCGERTEAKQSFDDPPLEECPHCGGQLRKLFSPVGIVFKGSGFYSTDAKAKAKTGSSSDKPSDAKPETKTETKSETKSETKTPAKKESAPKEKSA